MLNNTAKDLRKSRFLLRTMLDDGKSTMLMRKFEEYEIYLMPHCGAYYRLEREEFKDKAYLLVNYHDIVNTRAYISKKSPRPTLQNSEFVMNSPKVIPLTSFYFEFK